MDYSNVLKGCPHPSQITETTASPLLPISEAEAPNNEAAAAAEARIESTVALLSTCKSHLPFTKLDSAVHLFPQIHEQRPLAQDALDDLAAALTVRFLCAGRVEDWDEMMGLRVERLLYVLSSPAGPEGEDGVGDTPDTDTDTDTDTDLGRFAQRMLAEFDESIPSDALHDLIHTLQPQLRILNADVPSPSYVAALCALSDAQYMAYRASGDASCLSDAVSNLKDAFTHIHAHGAQSVARNIDLEALEARIPALALEQLTSDDEFSLEEGFTRALRARGGTDATTPRPDDFRYVMRCAEVFDRAKRRMREFEASGSRQELDGAISLHREALEMRSFPHPYRPESLEELGKALTTRFNESGEASDLEEAIKLFREALHASSAFFSERSDRGELAYNLGTALAKRFVEGGAADDLDEAVCLFRQSLDSRPAPHPSRHWSLFGLANVLSMQGQLTGKHALLDEAVDLQREALRELGPAPGRDHDRERTTLLSGLGNALWFRARYAASQRSDVDEAILVFRQCVDLFDANDLHRYAAINHFAMALVGRFELLGKAGDLDDAIFWQKQCVEYLERVRNPQRHGILGNLANMLALRHQRGHGGDLDEAISLQRRVLNLEGRRHANTLNNLGNLLSTKFTECNDVADLEESIALHRHALALRPPPFSDRYTSLVNLAIAVSKRFECNGNEDDFQEVVALYREAISLLPAKHQKLFGSYHNLAKAYCTAYSKFNKNELLEQAMDAFSVALQIPSLSPTQRLLVAQSWAFAADEYHHPTVLGAYDTLLQVARERASLSLDIESRQQSLSAGGDSLARKAALCAIRLHDYGKAIEYLEAGRAVVWSQVLHLRTPLDRLLEEAPDLGERLRDISSKLEVASHRDTFAVPTDNKRHIMLEKQERELDALTAEWHSLIDQVRGINGFEDFLLPPRLSVLRGATSRGPVVFLIPAYEQSHCLIMTATDVHQIQLPALPVIELLKMKELLHAASTQETLLRSSIEHIQGDLSFFHENIVAQPDVAEERATRRAGALRSDDIFKYILRVLWNELVKPVLGVLGITASAERPTIRWCPTDLFTFLPIHAAGNYDSKEGSESISDYVISTYTPTIERLLTSNHISNQESFHMLAVVDTKRLSCASEELDKIKARVPNDHLVQLGASKDSPSNVKTILSHLSTASIVHFACHGTQDRNKPLQSGLLVDDGLLTISKIMQQQKLNGSLAFLCACETAMGDENLPDEAMSLGASLLFSGFRSVIATMWNIQDRDGPIFADAFYEELFKGSDGLPMDYPDVNKSIQAFDFAVQKLRSKGAAFRYWVPFVHLGQ
ncbi:hypothetical protein JR316_0003892 [Psilocybe cubensis]|uniref:Uncharacterized protein n=2 Tax=Psilocybe cubensis TaxID=181762 RepID=A0ACB8H970_PSICU|nr:hypothetical protein JR316_0003892 [Psilocybe cubensis]KAH9484411.1 hypothetical protein JR316_0003892 [Psilocybe cubensis]